MQTVRPGQIVTSIAGRDQQRQYVVVRVVDAQFVEVANGSTRLLGNPKRKNRRHLMPQGYVDIRLAEKLARNPSRVTDAEIAEVVSSLKAGQEEASSW